MKYKRIHAAYPEPVSRRALWVRYGVAAIFVVLALSQLFAFETFPDVLENMLPARFDGLGLVIAALLVTLEVAAVPSLLLVKLSPAARWVSQVSGPLVMVLWYMLVFIGMTKVMAVNSGLFGSKIGLEANVWSLVLIVTIFGLAIAAHGIGSRRLSK